MAGVSSAWGNTIDIKSMSEVKNEASTELGSSFSSMLQKIADQELKSGENTNTLGWPQQQVSKPDDEWKSNGFTFNSGFGPLVKSDCWSSDGPSSANPWSSSSEIDSADSKTGERSKFVWNTEDSKADNATTNLEPIGPGRHRRTSSAADSVTSTEGKQDNGESTKDVRSQPDGAEVAQQNKEELISKIINSNEGWGKKPVRQDIPWQVGTSEPASSEPLKQPSSAASTGSESNVFWNQPIQPAQPKDNGMFWNEAAAQANSDMGNDGNSIGTWGSTEQPQAVNNGLSSNIQQLKKLMMLFNVPDIPSLLQHPGAMSNPLVPALINELFSKDPSTQRNGFPSHMPPSNPLSGISVWNSGESHGSGGGNDIFAPGKIGHWDPTNVPADTTIGTWDGIPQVPPKAVPLITSLQQQSNVYLTAQQLIDLGFNKDEAYVLQKLSGDKLYDLLINQRNDSHKGRIIRARSDFPTTEHNTSSNANFMPFMPNNGPSMAGFPGNQMPFNRPSGNMMNRSGPMSGQLPRTNMPQPQPQINQAVLALQSELQPLLQLRSQLQHNMQLPIQRKQFELEQLNVKISAIKQQIGQCQAPPPFPGDMTGGNGPVMQGNKFNPQQDMIQKLVAKQAALGGIGGNNEEAFILQQLMNKLNMGENAPNDHSSILSPNNLPGGHMGGLPGPGGLTSPFMGGLNLPGISGVTHENTMPWNSDFGIQRSISSLGGNTPTTSDIWAAPMTPSAFKAGNTATRFPWGPNNATNRNQGAAHLPPPPPGLGSGWENDILSGLGDNQWMPAM